jgi:hypothetical protein
VIVFVPVIVAALVVGNDTVDLIDTGEREQNPTPLIPPG